MLQQDIEIILTGALVSFSCSLLGCYLILRKMAMIGDAISHSVLPGIVIAFLITGGARESLVMVGGATLVGILTTLLIEFFHKKTKLQEDASIGVTFTSLFAIGVILVSLFAGKVDLDQDCVLYGELAFAPLDRWITSEGLDLGPRSLWTMGIVFALVLIFITSFFKELYLTTFDANYAISIGISATLWHYALMGFVSLTTVAAFKSVGAILVVAFLITPPATAYLLTDRFTTMLFLSCLIGLISTILGYYLSVILNGSVAGGMATAAGLLFALALLFSPSNGIVTKKLFASKKL